MPLGFPVQPHPRALFPGCTAPLEDSSVRTYRSIFLDDGWAHQKYYGWCLAEDHSGLRVLQKQHLGITRSLILLTSGGESRIDEVVARCSGRSGFTDVIVHDFDRVLPEPPALAGRRFHQVDSDRLLNIATFAIDLTPGEADILAQMSADYRRKIRIAESRGIVVEAHDAPSAELRDRFFDAYRTFAKERGLGPINRGVVSRMYSAGDATLFTARKGGGEISNYLHVYTTDRAGIFMYSVNLIKENDGAGQYLHWRAIQRLKQKGLGWYDLGGVASLDPADGIYNFKAKFGGKLTPLGVEWRRMGGVFRLLKGAAEASKLLNNTKRI
jgi:hypothetical protein